MSTEKQQLDRETRWKSRYYQVREELASKEQSWREVERLLRQMFTNLPLAAGTPDLESNQGPSGSGNETDDSRDVLEFETMISLISEKIAELDKINKQDFRGSHPANVFLEILEKLELSEELTKEYKQLKKNIKKLKVRDDSSEVSAGFMNIIQRYIHDDEEIPEPDRKQKLITRLLSRSGQTEQTSSGDDGDKTNKAVPQRFIAPAVGELLLQLALRMPNEVKRRINFGALKKHTNKARRRKDLIPIIDVIAQQIESAYRPEDTSTIVMQLDSVNAVSEAIGHFFQQLKVPVDLEQHVFELEQFYSERKDDVDSLLHCLHSMAEVVADICNRLSFQRDVLERYFSEFSSQLQELAGSTVQISTFSDEILERNKQMASTVQREVKGIRTSLELLDNSKEFNENIRSGLDAIDNHVNDFCRVENKRMDEAQKVIAELKEKINSLEENKDALHNQLEQTRQQVHLDVLTGIPNRQAYEERLAEEIARCNRYGSALTMVLWEIDGFRDITVKYGRAAGDRILKGVAGILKERIRKTDFIARYSGELFVTLMTETDLDTAKQVAEKLCGEVNKTPIHFRETRVSLTISTGLSEYQTDELANTLFERAETALQKTRASNKTG